jgi:hypothetical protein
MKKLKFNILNFNFNNFYIKNYFNYEENRLIFKESNILYKKNILYTRKKNYYYFESYKKKKKLILFKNINFNNYLKKNLNEKFINFFLKKFIKFFFYKIFFIKNILINFYFKKFTGFSNGLKNLILMRLKSKYRISHYINLLYKTLLNNNFSIIGLKIGYFGRYKKKLRNKKI